MSPSLESPSLLDQLNGQVEMRPFPAVASQILATCDNPRSGPRDLAGIIQCDPAVALRLLRVANSSMYGFAGEIRSVDHAIVVLGLKKVRSLAVSAAAADVFAAGQTAAAERETLWLHSLASASIAGLLAPRLQLAAEEAFLAGMVHDVGKLIFYDVVPDDYSQLTQQADPSTAIGLELSGFGASHEQLGGRCAETWGLPGEVNAAIGFHHDPAAASHAVSMAGLVGLASCLARAWRLGGCAGTDEAVTAAIERAELLLSEESRGELRETASRDYQTLKAACGP